MVNRESRSVIDGFIHFGGIDALAKVKDANTFRVETLRLFNTSFISNNYLFF